jgi:hypothetical protein
MKIPDASLNPNQSCCTFAFTINHLCALRRLYSLSDQGHLLLSSFLSGVVNSIFIVSAIAASAPLSWKEVRIAAVRKGADHMKLN